ncbi:MAG TPA: PEP-CTERM sorting domain-containing protein [Kamptonema sp.]|nr:PEP-CTERM sorting domain-containing protein [Kamptonema sp.]
MATAIAWGEAAGASNFQSSLISKIGYSGNSFLAQASPSTQNTDLPPFPTSDLATPSPARVPEPATLAGLGVVAGSFVLTRRRTGKKEI